MGTKHKHADKIIAWANGADIQYRSPQGRIFNDDKTPYWDAPGEFRVKRVFEDWQQKLIDAATEGKVVQYYSRVQSAWIPSALYVQIQTGYDIHSYGFAEQDRYRIKPEEVEPTVHIDQLTLTGTRTLSTGETEPYKRRVPVGATFNIGDTYNFKMSFSE